MESTIRTCPNPACKAPLVPGMLFCSNCKMKIPDFKAGAESLENCPPEELLKLVRLEYSCLSLVTGSHAVIPLRFANVESEQQVTSLKLTVQCSACKQERDISIERTLALARGGNVRLPGCEFDVDCSAGSYTLDIRGHFFIGDDRVVAFRASEPITILDRNSSKPHIKKLKVADGAAMAAANLADVQIEEVEISGGAAADLDWFATGAENKSEEQCWQALDLEFAPTKTRLLEEFLSGESEIQTDNLPEEQAELNSRAFWRIQMNDGPAKTVQIFTGDRFTLGRNIQEVDLATVFLPASEKNMERSLGISGRHCVITIEDRKALIADCGSKNGVRIGNKRVAEDGTGLIDGNRIILGNVFRMDYREFRNISQIREVSEIQRCALTINEFSTQISELKLDELVTEIPLDCFVIKRCDEYQNRLEYLFLRRYAGIGSASSNGLRINHPSVGKKHARLVLLDNGYNLEALDTGRETWIDNTRLYPGRPELLPANQPVQLRFGEVSVSFQAVIGTEK